MNFLKALNTGALKLTQLPYQPSINQSFKRFRRPSSCDLCLVHPDKRPCFDIRHVEIERGNPCHAKLIRSFLYEHYWPREPSVVGLWMSLDSPYLDLLTDKYSHQGDRFLAFERMERTNEKKLIGVCVANRVWPWMIDELEEWAHHTVSCPDKHRIYFSAHCLKNPNIFEKHHTDYVYDIEVLGSSAEVTGQGVATLLLRTALAQAYDLRYPVTQLCSVSRYTEKCAERCGMSRQWSMNYSSFVDDAGQSVFYPRAPHHTVSLYVKTFDLKKG